MSARTCSVCLKACDVAILTVIGPWCSGCYQTYRDSAAAAPRDVREFRTAARAAGLRVEK